MGIHFIWCLPYSGEIFFKLIIYDPCCVKPENLSILGIFKAFGHAMSIATEKTDKTLSTKGTL